MIATLKSALVFFYLLSSGEEGKREAGSLLFFNLLPSLRWAFEIVEDLVFLHRSGIVSIFFHVFFFPCSFGFKKKRE